MVLEMGFLFVPLVLLYDFIRCGKMRSKKMEIQDVWILLFQTLIVRISKRSCEKAQCNRLYFDISAGQTMKQMDLWCFTSFAHIFFAQIHICLTNKEARIHLWRAVRNNRPEPHPQACG